jgi:hypothetical protein
MSRCFFAARHVPRSHTANKIPSVDFAKSYYAGFCGALSRLWRIIVNFTFDFGFPDGYV